MAICTYCFYFAVVVLAVATAPKPGQFRASKRIRRQDADPLEDVPLGDAGESDAEDDRITEEELLNHL